jgi:hypothetical protein
MKKKRTKSKKKDGQKSNRGRKPNRAVLSGIMPDQETLPEILWRIIWGSPEWAMVALRQSIKNGSQLKDNPFWNKLCTEFQRTVLNRDDAAAADWFRRHANAIEKGGSPQRAEFYAKVVHLAGHAMWDALGWRDVTNEEREAFPFLQHLQKVPVVVRLTPVGKFPDVVTLTPAGKSTNATASDIWKAVVDTALKEPETNSLIEQQLAAAECFGFSKGRHNKKRQTVEQIVAEIYGFKTKAKAIDAIHKLATLLQFAPKKQARKRSHPPQKVKAPSQREGFTAHGTV